MGRGSKWISLAKKAKAFVSSKRFRGLNKTSRKTNDVVLPKVSEETAVQEREREQEHEQEQEQEIVDEGCPKSPPSAPSKALAEDVAAEEHQETLPEESAAVKIQAAFRGAAARKKVRKMKSMRRLRSMLHGKAAKRQTSHAMLCIQSFAKMQSQVRFQRARLTEIQSQRKDDHREKPEEEQIGDWDDSIFSKDQIRAKIQSKHAAATKRERTLAYAFSHQQWRSYPKDSSPPSSSSDDDDKPAWNWSWIEQWMTSRSWDTLEDPKPASNCLSPARFVASPGRNKQQVPVSYKKIAADIQPKFAPGSPTTRIGTQAQKVQRKLTYMSSPNRMQSLGSSSAKVHDSSEVAMIKPAAKPKTSLIRNGVSNQEEVAASPARTKNGRMLMAKTNGSMGFANSPGRRSPKLVPVKAL